MLFKHDTLHIFYTIGILGSQITILMNIIDQNYTNDIYPSQQITSNRLAEQQFDRSRKTPN